MKIKILSIIIAFSVLEIVSGTSNACYNYPPNAVLYVSPADTNVGVIVTFDGSDSSDPGGSIKKYEWDFDGDGKYDGIEFPHSGYGMPPCDGITEYAYIRAGTYTAKLRVTDNGGATGTDTCVVTIRGAHNLTQDKWYTRIQSALNDANNNDVIEVSEGTYNETISFSGVSNCTVRSTDPNNWSIVEQTVIDGNDSAAAVTFSSGQGSGSVLRGLKLTGGIYGISCSNSSSPTIRQCIISGNSSHGINCTSGSPTVIGNKISNNGGNGIYSSASAPPAIKNNWIYANNNGIEFSYANSAAVVRNNTIVASVNKGIRKSSGTAPNISNCIIWDNGDDLYGCNATYSCISDCDDVGDPNTTHNICSNPCFEDADADNFHLDANSPCRDAGDTYYVIYAGELDIDGEIRFFDNAVDIGGDELKIWYVDADANGSDNGSSWEDAFTSLGSALYVGSCGNEIWVAEGTYKPVSWWNPWDPNIPMPDIFRFISFSLKDGIRLYGGFDGTETLRRQRDWKNHQTILSGDIGVTGDVNCWECYWDNSYNVVTGADDAVIDGFTVTAGCALEGYWNPTRPPSPFSVFPGGGMCNIRCSPIIRNCAFTYNWSSYGGAIYNGASSPTITNCIFFFNNASIDGDGAGGAIYNFWGSNPVITNCAFNEDGADHGSAIFSTTGSAMLNNVTLTGCTFSNNGGPYTGVLGFCSSSAVITNCISWSNDLGGCGPEIYSYNSNIRVSYSNVEDCGGSGWNWDPDLGVDGGGNIDDEPNYVDLDDPDGADGIFFTSDDGLELEAYSPGIDAADGDIASSADITGRERIDVEGVNNTGRGDPDYVDMGAYEYDDD